MTDLLEFSESAPNPIVIRPAIPTMLRLAEKTPPGIFVEFGVYRGGSAWYLARLATFQGRELHLFDTFTGIPFHGRWDAEHRVGDFGDVDIEAVKAAIPSAIFHVGIFPHTFPPMLPPIAFAHIDCDQYQSCLDAIGKFWPLMVSGGIMLFDDYETTSGVTKVVNEMWGEELPRTQEGKCYVTKE